MMVSAMEKNAEWREIQSTGKRGGDFKRGDRGKPHLRSDIGYIPYFNIG